jgi:hypothetical protein
VISKKVSYLLAFLFLGKFFLTIGVPEHLVQRDNTKQIIFANDGDMKAYVIWLKNYV